MLFVDKVVLLSVCDIMIRMVIILLDELDDLLGVVDWIVVSLLIMCRTRCRCMLCVVVEL